jgi:hypothetical protein
MSDPLAVCPAVAAGCRPSAYDIYFIQPRTATSPAGPVEVDRIGHSRQARAGARGHPRARPVDRHGRPLRRAAARRPRSRRDQDRARRRRMAPRRRRRRRHAATRSTLVPLAQPQQAQLAVDLKSPDARIVYSPGRPADVFLQNYRPGVAERLGVDYATLSSAQSAARLRLDLRLWRGRALPRLRPGQDLLLQGMSGAMLSTGREGDRRRPRASTWSMP